MDLNLAFGHQELFQTLSQSSNRSSSNSSKSTHKSSGKYQNQGVLGSNVDEQAVRRLGRKLSIQAHGGQIPPPVARPSLPLERSEQSSFSLYSDVHGDPSTSVAEPKADPTQSGSLLRRLTVDCKDLYSKWIIEEEKRKKDSRVGERRNSRSRRDSDAAMLDIVHDSLRQRRNNGTKKGLLSAVFENNSDSNTTVTSSRNYHRRGGQGGDSTASPGTISTKETGYFGTTEQSTGSVAPEHVRGKCLTEPSEGAANDGLDNQDGNLIVHENDTIVVPRKNLRTLRSEKGKEWKSKTSDFRIQSLQGQGTFAQVFQCIHVQTNESVAIKIVKNKSTYTRQAAIEIDIFQTLIQEGKPQTTPSSTPQTTYLDHMVGLKAYFMHLDHLCLVFDLLGMNLYDVLKAREFRGLPLRLVREITRQTVFGVRFFSQKNVVHCDLKPENILMANGEIGNRLVMEGMGKKRTFRRRTDDQIMKTESGSQGTGSEDSTGTKTCIVTDSTGTQSQCGSGNSGSGGSGSHRSGEVVSASSGSTIPTSNPVSLDTASYKIKLIDFGSACFEGHTSHTYIQSRFYRSPEVLIGLPYDSAIDMWSLGCIAAELFLGLPILPGSHEHDQAVRISEMISDIPDWMLEQGSKAKKCYVKYFPKPESTPSSNSTAASSNAPIPAWRLKTHEEYIVSLSQAEVRKKGGRKKLSATPKNRYFKRKRLSDIVVLHAQHSQSQDDELLAAFVHFLYGVLDPDPWKRLTAFQASQHPFITGDLTHLRPRKDMDLNPKEENQANLLLQIYWAPPWDPTVCRRKLLNVQKIRERQQSLRRRSNKSSGAPSALESHRHRRHGSDFSLSESLSTSVHISNAASPMQISDSTPPTGISRSPSSGSQAQYGDSMGQFPKNSMGYSSNNFYSDGIQQTGYVPQNAGRGMAMDSSQVTDSYASMEGDTQSIERPGIFPGSYGDPSLTSQGSVGSFQSGSTHSTSQMKSQNTYFGSYQGRRSTGAGYGSSHGHGQYNNANQNYYGQGMQPAPPQVVIPGQLGDTVSVTSSIAMSETPMMDMQQMALFQQQMAFFQQQQQQQFGFFPAAAAQQAPEMQQMPMQPQQFPPQPMQFQPGQAQPMPTQPMQQPGTEMPSQQPQMYPQQQQQPVMMMQNPAGGGFYYMTTSATGQPVILQPVGFFNQQTGQQQNNNYPQGAFPQPPVQQQQYPASGAYPQPPSYQPRQRRPPNDGSQQQG